MKKLFWKKLYANQKIRIRDVIHMAISSSPLFIFISDVTLGGPNWFTDLFRLFLVLFSC